MAIFSNSEITRAGHELLTRVLAGECKLKFTLAQAGDGRFDGDVMDLTGLVNHRVDGRIVGVREMGLFTELECLITNQTLTALLEFREIGIRAVGTVNDVPIGDSILFSYANAGDYASPVGPFNGVWLHEEQFTIRVYTANATDIRAEIVPTTFATEVRFNNTKSGLTAEDVQAAIDELATSVGAGGSIELSDREIPARGTRAHLRIVGSVPGYQPFAPEPGAMSAGMLNVDGLGVVDGYIKSADGTIDQLKLQTT